MNDDQSAKAERTRAFEKALLEGMNAIIESTAAIEVARQKIERAARELAKASELPFDWLEQSEATRHDM